jgi:hypothetical protein
MSNDDLARRSATEIGRGVERLASIALDAVDDVALRALERLADAQPGGEAPRVLSAAASEVRSRTAPVPRLLARLSAGSVYAVVRTASVGVRAVREVVADTAGFVGGDVTLGRRAR